MSEKPAYPGSGASAKELVDLASEYHRAAHTLLQNARRRQPLTCAPSRQCAIHAVELYLNAYLLCFGHTPEQIRSQSHNLSARTTSAIDLGLKLRKKTVEHLAKMTQEREYLISRYGPEVASTRSEITRLIATLEEVAKKVRQVVLGQKVEPVPAGT